MDFVSQNYWDESYKNFNYYMASDAVTKWLDKYDVASQKGALFEFGCFPGRYLSYMGKRGWVVSGMDMTPAIETDFKAWLQKQKISTGLIKQGDALDYAAATTDKYDAVCSFGFIEHFENYTDLIELHDKILKEQGWLFISTPNFRGRIQKLLHQKLNKESLKIHYLPSMRPDIWEKGLKKLGYEILYAGYFGGFDFWYDEAQRTKTQRFFLKLIRKVKPYLKSLPDSGFYSPYCGIVAQKLTK